MSIVESLNEVNLRKNAGTGSSRAARRQGMIPAIIYGNARDNLSISLSKHELLKHYNGSGFYSKIFEIKLNNHNLKIIPKAIQLHPVSDDILHIDFIDVSKAKKVTTNIKLNYINLDKCRGMKLGGKLNIVKRHLTLECEIDKIPGYINIDLENLAIGKSLHINDLSLPKGCKSTYHSNIAIAAIVGRGGGEEEKTEDEEAKK